MYVGSVYNISVWVMLQPTDGSNHVINMSLQTTLDGNTSYPSVTRLSRHHRAGGREWHQISVIGYTMASSYDPGTAFLYFQTVPSSGNDLVSFYIDDFQLTYVPPPTIQTNIPSIYKTFASFFPIGAEVDTTDLSGPHAQLLTMHFNSITSGNDLKWSSVEATWALITTETPTRGWASGVQQHEDPRTEPRVGDRRANARLRHRRWHEFAANQAMVTANIQEHIQSEVQHFGTKVYAWDVVNEPLDPTQPDCLEHGPFYQVLGPSYIDIAFKAARQYAPAGTKLFHQRLQHHRSRTAWRA